MVARLEQQTAGVAELPIDSRSAIRSWLIVSIVGLGFLFDYYEIIVQAITVRPAIMDLGGFVPGSPEYNRWVGWLLYLPFVCGGLLGLVGGYLTDRLGRRRVLVSSIVIYGVATIAAGFAQTPAELLLWRCVTIAGVSVETIAALAWIAETFTGRRREAALGYTQVFSGVSGFLVTGVYYLAVTYADLLPAVRGEHEAWRYALIFGAVPVVPVLIARWFLPESHEWLIRKRQGTLRRPTLRELFAPSLRVATLSSCVLVACVFVATSGTLQQVARMVPGLPQVAALPRVAQEQTVSVVSLWSDFAGIGGRVLLAMIAVSLLTRRRILQTFLAPALAAFAFLFFFAAHHSLELVKYGLVVAVIGVVAMHSFIGNYLPQLFPLHLRGTGESLAYSIGGRIVGMAGALLVANITNLMPGETHSAQLAYAAGTVGIAALLILAATSRFLPEPRGRDLD